MTAEYLPIEQIRAFDGHPFQVKNDDEMEQLTWSILTQGLLTPIVVRPIENGCYEVISGHRRLHACKRAGIDTVPALVRSMNRDEAAIALVDSNLHREHILPSEKAFAYKLKMEALNRQGTSRQVGEKWSVAQISESGNDSERQVHRYIRLTNLIPDILAMVDKGRIALTPAVELSYLTREEQTAVYTTMDYDQVTPSLSQAQRLHRMSLERGLSEDEIMEVLAEVKGNQKEYVKVPVDSLRCYFHPDATFKQMTETLVKAMEYYSRHLARQRSDRDAR